MGDAQMVDCRFANQFERRIQNTFSITARVRWGPRTRLFIGLTTLDQGC